ncbi:hypothetical protein C8Q75DRAFT_810448 [Abortiporus biennis]|nr:hypothetical protein C8Q75DRAFT_810448 [Abortiporus biennis]
MIITESSTEYAYLHEKTRPAEVVLSATLSDYPPSYEDDADPPAPPPSTYTSPSQQSLRARGSPSHLYSPASPVAGPSQSSSTNTTPDPSNSNGVQAFFDKLKTLTPGVDPEKLLNPPPICFYRAPPEVPRTAFPPITTLGFGSKVDKGFLTMPPPTHLNPHPFALHDVNEEDWTTFLSHVKLAASLNGTDALIIIASFATWGIGIGFGGLTYFMTKGIQKHTRTKKEEFVAIVVDHWNSHFFNPRCLNITLARGKRCITGPAGSVPPDMEPTQPAQPQFVQELPLPDETPNEAHYDSSDSSDLEETSPDDGPRHPKPRAKLQRRRDWREGGKEAIKWMKHRNQKDFRKSQVRLIVSYFEPVA